MLNEDQTQLVKTVDFGDEVDQFLKSRVGRYILERAEVEIEEATNQLKRVDPDDSRKVRHWQSKIGVAESVQIWLIDAVEAGLKAEAIIHGEEDANY